MHPIVHIKDKYGLCYPPPVQGRRAVRDGALQSPSSDPLGAQGEAGVLQEGGQQKLLRGGETLQNLKDLPNPLHVGCKKGGAGCPASQ